MWKLSIWVFAACVGCGGATAVYLEDRPDDAGPSSCTPLPYVDSFVTPAQCPILIACTYEPGAAPLPPIPGCALLSLAGAWCCPRDGGVL